MLSFMLSVIKYVVLMLSLVVLVPGSWGLNYISMVVVNDVAALRGAIAANTYIKLKCGMTYSLTTTALTIPATADNLTIEGCGWGSVIDQGTDSVRIIQVDGTSGDQAVGIQLKNFKVTATATTKHTDPLLLAYCDDCLVDTIHADSIAAGSGGTILCFPGCDRTIIRNNYVIVSGDRGIYIQAGNSIVATDNIIENNFVKGSAATAKHIILFEETRRTIIRNNRIDTSVASNAGHGIDLRLCSAASCGTQEYPIDTIIENNIIYGGGAGTPINIESAKGGTIRGNIILDTPDPKSAIYLSTNDGYGSNNWIVTGNFTKDCDSYIGFNGADNILVVGNFFDGKSGSEGMLFTSNASSDIKIQGNVTRGGGSAIQIDDTTGQNVRVDVTGNRFIRSGDNGENLSTVINEVDLANNDAPLWYVRDNHYSSSTTLTAGFDATNVADNFTY